MPLKPLSFLKTPLVSPRRLSFFYTPPCPGSARRLNRHVAPGPAPGPARPDSDQTPGLDLLLFVSVMFVHVVSYCMCLQELSHTHTEPTSARTTHRTRTQTHILIHTQSHTYTHTHKHPSSIIPSLHHSITPASHHSRHPIIPVIPASRHPSIQSFPSFK